MGKLSTRSLLIVALVLVIVKTNVTIVAGYGSYFPPDFDSDFLLGRETYFYGTYHWAFYAHLVSGPFALILGTVLLSERLRRSAPAWHRRLGRVQIACILLVLAPSGLWMAPYAATGAVAAWGLGFLALATAGCAFAGWRAAATRRFGEHRRWMLRTYVLLTSAVVIRLVGGLATVLNYDAAWVYPVSTWASWLLPLAIFELCTAGRPVAVAVRT